ncbi:hypothetical protein ACJQWK_00882 [Exserohilum turcicum]
MTDSSLYQPLDTTRDEFRLLRIEPSHDFDNIISCQLFTVSRADKPSYCTLSYEWGDKTVTKPMLANGIIVQVTRNLEAALRRIRQSNPKVVIWVDAVCINQHDIVERNSQVAMMGKLYSETTLTYAWLGEDNDGSAQNAFQFIRSYFGHFSKRVEDIDNFILKMTKNIYDDAYFEARDQVMDNLQNGKLALDMFKFHDISKVSLRTYWFRTWVQQELILSPRVVLISGPAAISFNLMVVFSLLIFVVRSHVMQRTEPAYETISNMLPSHFAGILQLAMVDVTSFVSVLSSLQKCVATNPRDHVYGILGIYEGAMTVAIDYDKPVAQVFVDLVHSLAEESGQLILRQFPGVLIVSRL